ncbi:hypothetical protein QF035_010301 [Streptomyces umbrinus]|uniref:Uncharacterized protein n=1 Tax=Streptomyces umbrinus TaxID=67370 RepID=A0ABU0TA82_9ACTN|nr:hypothetical protein [Streptomyces umbrinus]MDQ1032719.1 hypothetical protein [Streptomyces umbrinus]
MTRLANPSATDTLDRDDEQAICPRVVMSTSWTKRHDDHHATGEDWIGAHEPGGLLFVALGLVLVAAGFLWRGRVLRPVSVNRAQAAVTRDRSRNLLRSADMAIAEARRRAAGGEPAIVTVGDVTRAACQHYGLFAEREEAAAALRQRHEAADCRLDCTTDAFS